MCPFCKGSWLIVNDPDIFGVLGPVFSPHPVNQAQPTGWPSASKQYGRHGWCLGTAMQVGFAEEVAADVQAGIRLRAHP